LSAQRKGKKVVGGTRRSTTPENIVDVLSQIADEVNWTPNERKKEKYFQCIVLLYSLTENLLKWLIFVKVLWDRSASLSLAKEGLVAKDLDANFVDVHKTSRTPVRLFEPLSIPGSQTESVGNPQVGTHLPLFDSAYISTTGYPYTFHGTAKPIHVIKVSGNMAFELILDDLFRLSNLTWTRVDDCSRVPISIKMTDIRLREVAGDYNVDAFRFATTEEES